MPRIAKSDVHAAMLRAANHIKDAAGSDGVSSRADIQAKLKDLDGTEKALVDIFARFIDHRDFKPGARITAADVDKALEYAKEKLVDAYDLNNNGLSNSEIAEMSRTAQLATELARELKAAPAAGRGPAALSDAMKAAVAGGFAELAWQDGFLIGAKVSTGWDNQGLQPAEQLTELLGLPEAQKLETLRIGLPGSDGMSEYDEALAAVAAGGPRPALKNLTIGEFEFPDETEISWVTVGNVGPALDVAPNLESLTVRGGGIELGNLNLAKLRELNIESGGLPGSSVRALSSAKLPALETLDVWFGAEEYGAGGDASMLKGLLEGEGVPKLTHLGLKNSEFQNEIAKAVAESPLLARLTSLDLSMGTLTDDGAQPFLGNPDTFRHLESLDLSDNYISDSLGAELQDILGAGVRVQTDKERDPYDDYLYVSVGE